MSPDQPQHNIESYDVTKNTLTQLYDRVNYVTQTAKDTDAAAEEVAAALNEFQVEVERCLPASWWVDRDYAFDNVREQVLEANSVDERQTYVIEFCVQFTETLMSGDLRIEP